MLGRYCPVNSLQVLDGCLSLGSLCLPCCLTLMAVHDQMYSVANLMIFALLSPIDIFIVVSPFNTCIAIMFLEY